jgi:hypothetical protein
MTRAGRSERQNHHAFEHLTYELQMLVATFVRLEGARDRETRNALIESFAIHARGLYESLLAEKPGSDVIRASRFVDDWAPADDPTLRNAKDRVDQEIAHVTYDRLAITLREKAWPMREIAEALLKVFRSFLDHLKPEHDNNAVHALKTWIDAQPLRQAKVTRLIGKVAPACTMSLTRLPGINGPAWEWPEHLRLK